MLEADTDSHGQKVTFMHSCMHNFIPDAGNSEVMAVGDQNVNGDGLTDFVTGYDWNTCFELDRGGTTSL